MSDGTRRFRGLRWTGMAVVICGGLLSVNARGLAATPPGGTVSSTASASWDFAAVTQSSPVKRSLVATNCPPAACDNYDLTVQLPAPPATLYTDRTAFLHIVYTWTNATAGGTDMDVFAFDPNGGRYGPGSPDDQPTGAGQEVIDITNPLSGVYHIRSIAPTAPVPTGAHAVATLTVLPKSTLPPNRYYDNYNAPAGVAQSSGEPSLGADYQHPGTIMYQSGDPRTFRITMNDTVSPPAATWTDVTYATQTTGLDPIGYMDHPSNVQSRWFSSQLAGMVSSEAYTDNAGATWQQTSSNGLPAGIDHQTVGSSPYTAGTVIPHTYPHAIYYCSHANAYATCSRSDDGGLTYGPGIPAYLLNPGAGTGTPVEQGCGGLHGHLKGSPDGTVYLPNATCFFTPASYPQGVLGAAVVVSRDNGFTWTITGPPDGSSKGFVAADPSVGVGSDNTVYLGYQGTDGQIDPATSLPRDSHPMIAVSHDHGATWSKSIDVGSTFGIQNIEFPEVIAGDGNRAAFAFLGTPTIGDDQAAGFPGIWHMYVATTYDGGQSWTTVDATPTDPVQRGCIWEQGGSNPCRNLLDFNDIQIDQTGRVLIAYTDGCVGACDLNPGPNMYAATAAFLRQTCSVNGTANRGLFAAYDATGFAGCSASPTAVHVSRFSAHRVGGKLRFSWRIATGSGVAGFDVLAAGHRLNARTIPAHRAPDYHFSVRWPGRGPYALRVFLRTGAAMLIPLH